MLPGLTLFNHRNFDNSHNFHDGDSTLGLQKGVLCHYNDPPTARSTP